MRDQFGRTSPAVHNGGGILKYCEHCGISENETRIVSSKFGILCRKHFLQMYRHGKFIHTIYDGNRYEVMGDYVKVYMYNKEGNEDGYTLIDLDDLEKVRGHKIGRYGEYARISLDGKRMFLHKYLVAYDMVDHINRDKLDNRKSNLRPTNKSGNAVNIDRGIYTGVWKVPSGRYQAIITVNYKRIYLGTFDTRDEALYQRYLAEIKYFGDNRVKDYDEIKLKIFREKNFI